MKKDFLYCFLGVFLTAATLAILVAYNKDYAPYACIISPQGDSYACIISPQGDSYAGIKLKSPK